MFLLPSAIGAIQQDPIRRIFKQASLDLQFAEKKSLVDATTGSNLVTFTRASSGTFVGSDGLIQSAVTNLLLRSEDLNDAVWAAVNTAVNTTAIAAPNGTTTGNLLTATSTANNTKRRSQSFSTIAGQTYTLTAYLKKASDVVPFGGLSLGTASSSTPYVTARWNLDTGTNTLGAATSGYTFTGQSIQNVGDGWYRCSVTGIIGTDADLRINVYAANSGTLITAGLSGARPVVMELDDPVIYVWGAQLEQSSTVGEYIPTTSTINSAPRFDHNPTTGESLGLLVEEQRTNLLVQSEDFSTTWSATRASVSTNAVAAPNGTTTAEKLIEDSTEDNSHFISQTATIANATAYTFSCFVKAAERFRFRLGFSSAGFGSTINASFNLQTSAITASAGVTASIIAYPDGWFRCVATATSAAASTPAFSMLLLSDAGGSGYTGDGTSGLFVWGAQLEAGAFPTSYIPTTTATVTRSADVASISGSNFDGWYRQDEGTFLGEAVATGTSTDSIGTAIGLAAITDGTNAERIRFGAFTTNTIWVDGNTTQANLSSGTLAAGSLLKLASSYAVDNFSLVRNAGAIQTDTSGTLPTVTQMEIGRSAVANGFYTGTIRRLTYWPQRLPNSTLQAVTQ